MRLQRLQSACTLDSARAATGRLRCIAPRRRPMPAAHQSATRSNTKPQDVQATALGEYVIPNFTPVMYVFDESGIAVTADFDNFSVTVTEVVPACTDAGLSNLDFASGLTGWKVLPESNQSPTLSVSGGEVTMTPIAVAGEHRWLIHETPMTAAAYDHYVHIQAEVWSNDPTSHSGVPQNGVALGDYPFAGRTVHHAA